MWMLSIFHGFNDKPVNTLIIIIRLLLSFSIQTTHNITEMIKLTTVRYSEVVYVIQDYISALL